MFSTFECSIIKTNICSNGLFSIRSNICPLEQQMIGLKIKFRGNINFVHNGHGYKFSFNFKTFLDL